MGFLNLVREEANAMRKRDERCFVLLPLLIVFCCLLLSGGSRLIGREGEELAQSLPVSVLRGVLCSAPAQTEQTSCDPARDHTDKAQIMVASMIHDEPDISVCSDANGNVLRCQTYLRAVYQAFSLGDGFA